ncbi:FAD-dependent oxidoreductase [Spongiivirga sp. MCCC 1A20706]|uniref:flavin monoamine oxidase family protein n=1 Tax=Spongiivirga sp. MCCC 1A20706 TaxID=3160963 RepID=UPI00397756DC
MKNNRNKQTAKQDFSRREMIKKSSLFIAATPFLSLSSCVSASKKAFDADVIVIGAGLSGLNAALLLEESGFSVKIVEATDRLGGRVHTAKESDVPGHPELGANGIGGGYARLLNAAQKYGVGIGPYRPRTEPRNGEILYAVKGNFILPEDWEGHKANPHPEGYRKGSPTSPPWSIYSKLNPLPKNDLVAWRNKEYTKWDKSVYEVLKEEGFSDEAIKLGVSTNSSYGVDAKNISVLMYFQILNFLTQQSQFNGQGGAAVGGNQRIPEAMGAAFKQDILMSSPVKSVASEADGVDIILEDDKKLRARYALITLPASALRRISVSPTPTQQKAFKELPYTPCCQIHFVPTKKYWEEDGLPPSMWCDTLAGRFMALKNDPNDPDKVTSCVAYLNSSVAVQVDNMNRETAIQTVTKTLEDMRPSLNGALKFVHYWTWIDNPYAGGAYAYWKPGQITEFADGIAAPNGRIHFAGEHTATISRGMEGAMESGERAAFEILNLL